jgi:D-alanine-D-alanine ligase
MPVWELFFTNMPDGAKRIATDRVKWSVKYQKKYGIDSGPARDLPEARPQHPAPVQARVPRARVERLRAHRSALEDNGNVWVLEANPNPQIAKGEDFAASAEKVG